MPRRPWRLALAVLLLVQPLAGCIDDDAPAEIEPSSDGAEGVQARAGPASMNATGCSQQRGLFAFPEDQLPATPEGFEPKPFPGDASGETARLATFAWSCTEAGGNASAPVSEGLFTLAVTPPDPYRDEGVDAYYLVFFAVSTSRERVDTYEAWGLPQFEQGNASLEIAAAAPGSETGQANVEGSRLAWSVETAVGGPTGTPGNRTVGD